MPPPKTPRRSGVVIPNAPKWYQRLAAWLIWAAFSLLSLTLRFRVTDPHGLLVRQDLGPVIYCIWHNRLALCMEIYRAFGRSRKQSAGMAAIVSASKDGALLAAILQCFGVQPVRGSSSRRGAQALLELSSWSARGYDLAITPDGPRGPRYVVAEGAVMLAQITGRPLVPVTYNLEWKIQLKSWDGFLIPLPFSRCEVVAGNVLLVPREGSDESREKLRRELEAELRAISHA